MQCVVNDRVMRGCSVHHSPSTWCPALSSFRPSISGGGFWFEKSNIQRQTIPRRTHVRAGLGNQISTGKRTHNHVVLGRARVRARTYLGDNAFAGRPHFEFRSRRFVRGRNVLSWLEF